jgi:hypothetical protein
MSGALDPRLQKTVIVPLLIVLGIQCWLIWGESDWGHPLQQKLLVGALALSLIPPVHRAIFAVIAGLRKPSVKPRVMTAVVIAILSAFYLVETAWYQGRNFSPKWQDELSYIVQFRMLAHGRLWMPRHPLADFFDSFQLIVDPVYASMYFPGAALFYTPTIWLHLPFWVISAALSGVMVALLYLIMTELIDGWAGLLAVVMVLGTSMFRKLSIMIGGHPPMLALEMLIIWSWLNWRKQHSTGWSIALGAFAGWAAITRPLDAIVVALPIGIAMLLDLRAHSVRRAGIAAACVFAAALPFLALQIIFNLGVTGKWYKTPFELYANRDYPGTTLGFHKFDPNLRPASKLPQKQKFHDEWTIPAIQRHRPELVVHNWLHGDLKRALADNMPQRMLMLLLPLGLVGLIDRRRVAVWSILPLFVIAFSFYTFNLPHYAIITLPAVVLTILLGARELETTWAKAQPLLATFLSLFILILSVTETAEVNRLVADEIFQAPPLAGIAQKLKALPHKPAVVLFRFDPAKSNPHEEPVYNIDSAWPDDAEVIRAHDLGARNTEIFRYYAARQPNRAFYLYHRDDDSIQFLGYARDLGN